VARAVVLYRPEFDTGPGWLIRSFLRNSSTSAEAVLWTYLKPASIDGRKFRRQHSIGKYIADFYFPSEKLILELDGEPHGDYIQIEKDKIRDKFLKGLALLYFDLKTGWYFRILNTYLKK
jgi:very-short-patch-repair endonuclease